MRNEKKKDMGIATQRSKCSKPLFPTTTEIGPYIRAPIFTHTLAYFVQKRKGGPKILESIGSDREDEVAKEKNGRTLCKTSRVWNEEKRGNVAKGKPDRKKERNAHTTRHAKRKKTLPDQPACWIFSHPLKASS